MSESVYSFLEYRDYLNKYFKAAKPGTKTKVATELRVHTSLLPQILNGNVELSLEQAEKFNNFFNHNEEESFYFILLVLKARAGTPMLRQRIEKQIGEIRKKRQEISNRVAKEKTISEKDQERFYSSYIYAAMHVLSSIPEFATIQKLSQALGRSEREISRAVDFLLSIGVVKQKNSYLIPGSCHIHLSPESPAIINHHLNWRFKSIDKIRDNPKTDIHYSGVISLSNEDVSKIKEIITSAIVEATNVATNSREETAYILCADFFSLSR